MMSHRFSLNEMNILDAALIASKALGSRLGSSKMNIVHKLELSTLYGILVCLLKWVSLLGKLFGVRC